MIPIGPELPPTDQGVFDSAPLLPPVDPTGPLEPGQLDISDFNFSKLPQRPSLPPPAVAVPVQEGEPASENVGEGEEGGLDSVTDLKIYEAVPLFILQRLLNDEEENGIEAISQTQV